MAVFEAQRKSGEKPEKRYLKGLKEEVPVS
jgi:hypothetical protein